jgi:flagellar protein FliO/FliZ
MILTLQSILTGLLSLAGIIAFILTAARFMRHRLNTVAQDPSKSLKLKETLAIDSRRRIHVIECEGHRALIMTGGPQDQFMGWVPSQ